MILAGLESVHTYGMGMLSNKIVAMVRGSKKDEGTVFQVRIC